MTNVRGWGARLRDRQASEGEGGGGGTGMESAIKVSSYTERRQADMPKGCLHVTAGDYKTTRLITRCTHSTTSNIFHCHREEAAGTGREGRQLT